MTRADFLAAIIAEPESDRPRLLFADWLDEHDEPERAEFIRVQCELARLPGFAHVKSLIAHGADPLPLSSMRLRAWELEGRERELLNKPGDWTPGVVWPSSECSTWERGFISCIRVPADWFLANADAFLASSPITTVRLTTWPAAEIQYGESAKGRGKLVGRLRWHSLDEQARNLRSIVTPLLRTEWPRVKIWNLPPFPDVSPSLPSHAPPE